MLNIALPKGRLGDQVYSMLRDAGYDCPAYEDKNRELVLESPEKGVRYLLVSPATWRFMWSTTQRMWEL